MKKFLVLLLTALLAISCDRTYWRLEYEYTITYLVDGVEEVSTNKINMSEKCVPYYMTNGSKIMVTALPNDYYHQWYIIYEGSGKTKVEDFSYKLLRRYEVSVITGEVIPTSISYHTASKE